MDIPLIYVLIAAEILLVLLGLSITFAVLLMRKPTETIKTEMQALDGAEAELDAVNLGTSYIDYLDQAMQRNTIKISQRINIEKDEAAEAATKESPEDKEDNTAPAPDEKQSQLLEAREQFLLIEKSAAEDTEHDIKFWENLYEGLQKIVDKLKSTEVVTESASEVESSENIQKESKEKVFYIETQGKKIDGEVNKLKDIISDQENALNSMQKAISDAEGELAEDSPSLAALKEQISIIERQLSDSKMCMDVLEMENIRLQEEVDKIENRHDALFEPSDDESNDNKESVTDLDKMKEIAAQQESKIQLLIETIESLEIEASQAERLKETLEGFTRTSQEMMSCITILEEENERLQETGHDEEPENNDAPTNNQDDEAIKSKISSLEEELIKKDVAYARLQDEFSSMETEYLSMYETVHGDKT